MERLPAEMMMTTMLIVVVKAFAIRRKVLALLPRVRQTYKKGKWYE